MGAIIPWIIVSLGGAAIFSLWVQKHYGWFAATMVAYPIMQSILYLWFQGSVFAKQFGAMALCNFVGLILVAHWVRKWKKPWWLIMYPVMAVLILGFGGGDRFFGNHSMAVCGVAIALPYILRSSGSLYILAIAVAVLLPIVSQTSVGLFALVLSVSLYFLLRAKRIFLPTYFIMLGAVGCCAWLYPGQLFNDSHRFQAWSVFLEKIPNILHGFNQEGITYKTALFGHGIGSFLYLNLKYVNLALFGGKPFLDAHNDFLQVYIMCGPVYFIALMAFICFIFRTTWVKTTGYYAQLCFDEILPKNEKEDILIDAVVLITFLSVAGFNFPSFIFYTAFPAMIATMNILERRTV